jgi:orotidine-5'-phosphate decarboxylase
VSDLSATTRQAPVPRIVFALDFDGVDEARAAAREVASSIGMVKVGLELFVHAGPSVVALGKEVGLPVFLDLKLHDIPETVERAVAQAAALGARLVTVHASGGRAMLRRAVARAKSESGSLSICAVTILTSLDDADIDDLGIDPARLKTNAPEGRSRASLAAEHLARLAFEEGVRWFVCSPAEVASIRAALGKDATLVTPGVRPLTADKGDQKRVATPEAAVRDGADWLVIGRPIRDAPDRLAAARTIADAMAKARR